MEAQTRISSHPDPIPASDLIFGYDGTPMPVLSTASL